VLKRLGETIPRLLTQAWNARKAARGFAPAGGEDGFNGNSAKRADPMEWLLRNAAAVELVPRKRPICK
jgi:hypothetical protein